MKLIILKDYDVIDMECYSEWDDDSTTELHLFMRTEVKFRFSNNDVFKATIAYMDVREFLSFFHGSDFSKNTSIEFCNRFINYFRNNLCVERDCAEYTQFGARYLKDYPIHILKTRLYKPYNLYSDRLELKQFKEI